MIDIDLFGLWFCILLIGSLFTVILLLTTSSCCSNLSSPTSREASPTSGEASPASCCSTSCCPPLELGIYLPDYPRKVFVRDQTQPNGRKEIKEEVEEEDGRDEGKEMEEYETSMERNQEDKV